MGQAKPTMLLFFSSIVLLLVLLLSHFYLFVCLFLAALGLCCCAWAFSSCSEWGLLFVVELLRLLIAVASLAAEHRL